MEQKGTDIKGQTIVFDLLDDKDKNVNIPEQSLSSSSKTSALENKVIKKTDLCNYSWYGWFW